jgi:hypothetical protein
MATCQCERNGGSSYYDRTPPAPALAVAPAERWPEWMRELFFAVLVALIVALIMRRAN